LKTGNSVSGWELDFEIDGFAALERTLAVHTNLAAATINFVLDVTILVVDVKNNVTAVEGVGDLSEVFALSVFNVSHCDFRSVEAIACAFARSVE